MHRDDQFRRRRSRQAPFQRGGRHAEAVGIDIDKSGFTARIDQTIRRSGKCDHRRQSAIARADAGGETGDMQSGGATADRDRVTRAYPFGKGRLEPLHQRPLGEKVAFQHSDHGIDVTAIDILPAIAEESHGRAYPITALSCSVSSHWLLVLLAYSKSGGTGRPRSPP